VRVILAYDFLRLTLRDCLWAPAMNAVLTAAFPPQEEEEAEIESSKDCGPARDSSAQRIPKRGQASGMQQRAGSVSGPRKGAKKLKLSAERGEGELRAAEQRPLSES
jgi:hypothetical protein